MAYAHPENKGRIFDNKVDRTKDSQPDYVGTINVEGKHYRLVGWYQPPSERWRNANIALQIEDQAAFQKRIDDEKKAKQGSDPYDHAPAVPPSDRNSDIPF